MTGTQKPETWFGLTAIAWTGIYTLLTAGLLLIASLAALVALRQLLVSRGQREDSRKAASEASRPYVLVTIEPSLASIHLFDICIRNYGKRPALEVRIELDPPPRRAQDGEGESSLASAKLFTETIAMIAPGQEIRAFYDSHVERQGKEGLPTVHSATISYQDTSQQQYKETAILDIEALKGIGRISLNTVHTIGKTLDGIRQVLRQSSVLQGSGTIEVAAVTESYADHKAREDEEAQKWRIDQLQFLEKHAPDDEQIPSLKSEIEQWEQMKHPIQKGHIMVSNDPATNPGVAEGSVASLLKPHEHDQEAAIKLEGAIESLNQLVGVYTNLIDKEKDQAQPNQQNIEEWQQGRRSVSVQLRSMSKLTPGEIDQLRSATSQKLQRLRSL